MSFDKGRIQGFGSDGSTSKVWKCPAGHMLQPWTAQPGACDSCHARVNKGDVVMDCRQCNWYLCSACHPHEQEQDDSWYGIFNSFVDAAAQEITEITQEFQEMAQEAETFVTEMMDSVSCVPTDKDQFGREEIDLSASQDKASSSKSKGKDKDKDKGKGREKNKEKGNMAEKGKGKMEQASEVKAPAAASDAADEAAPWGADGGMAEAPPKAKQPEDLLDFGQNDLLDLDLESDGPEEAPPASAPTAAMDNLLDIDIAEPVNTAAKVEPVIAAAKVGGALEELLDFSEAPGPTLLHTRGSGIPVLAPPAAPAISIA